MGKRLIYQSLKQTEEAIAEKLLQDAAEKKAKDAKRILRKDKHLIPSTIKKEEELIKKIDGQLSSTKDPYKKFKKISDAYKEAEALDKAVSPIKKPKEPPPTFEYDEDYFINTSSKQPDWKYAATREGAPNPARERYKKIKAEREGKLATTETPEGGLELEAPKKMSMTKKALIAAPTTAVAVGGLSKYLDSKTENPLELRDSNEGQTGVITPVEDDGKKDETVVKLTEQTKRAQSPEDMRFLLKRYHDQADKLPKTARDDLNARLNTVEDKLKEASDKYAQAKNTTEWKEFADRMGQALVQIGSGLHGYKKGIDLSGVKFTPKDYSDEFDRNFKEFTKTRDELATDKAQIAREGEKRDDREYREKENFVKAMVDNYSLERRLAAQAVENEKRLATLLQKAQAVGDDKAAKEAAKEMQKQYDEMKKKRDLVVGALGTMQAAEGDIDSKQKKKLQLKWRQDLIAAGKGDLIDQLEDKATDGILFWENGYKSKAVAEILQAQIGEMDAALSQMKSGGRSAQEETKVVNGTTYRKTAAGWEAID